MTNPSGIGASVPRKEDPAFLTGAGCFTDDIRRDGVAHGLVVRSPYPHARIARIDVAAARAAPGVLAVLTAADIAEDVPNPIPSFANTPPFNIATRDGAALPDAEQYPLARERVRYVGEPVVFVVAETLAQARDAAELVTVDYDELPAVVDYDQALAADATPIWPEHGGNLSFDWEGGDGPATDAAFAAAAHVAKVELDNNRVAITFMEPRAALAEIDPDNGRLTLHVGCQGAHGIQAILAQMLEIDAKELRVVAPDTGGGFGARGGVYAEFPLTLVAARRLGRAVKWTAERGEGFLADCQARDHILRGELALDADGRFTALRVAVDWRHGAYLTSRIAWVIVAYLPPTLGGVYGVPLGHFRIRGLFANATPQSAYRGVGRLESNYLMESLVDAAARQTGIDRVELRRRNLVAPEGMPWTAPGGAVYTSGQFADNLDRALELADWAGFPARRQAAEARGLLAGIGLGMFAENDGSTPTEYAEV